MPAARTFDGRVALVSGGDTPVGRAVALAFANAGAHVMIVCAEERPDTKDTLRAIEAAGVRSGAVAGDLGDETFAKQVVQTSIEQFARLDLLVNHAAEHHPRPSLEEISAAQLERTFRANVFAMFHLTRFALPHLGSGACIVNTASLAAYGGSAQLLDEASSKGAVVSFTRSLALQLAPRHIRVNAVAPGGGAEPEALARLYVFLASEDSAAMTGEVLRPNGGG